MSMEITRIVAERKFEINGGAAAVLRIGKPFEHTEGDWACPFQITGAGDDGVYEAYGVDSLQALALCLEMARIHLDGLKRRHALTWLGDEDLGI